MDVICERCATEYEFDDALLSERGTTVKCTNCGHQFKIFRPSKATPEELTRTWNLRRPDGTVIPFDSLAVLQKWIMEGRVSKMDEICRPGEAWKALGAIAELDSFFVTAEGRSAQAAPRASGFPPAVKGPTGLPRPELSAKATLPGGTPVPPPGGKGSLPPMGVQPLRAPTPPLGSSGPGKASLPPASTSPLRAPTPPGLRAAASKAPSLRPPTPPSSLRQGPPPPPPATPSAPMGTATPSGSALRAATGGVQIPPPPRLPVDLPGVPTPAVDPAPPRPAPPEPAIERRREMAIGPPPRMELDHIGPRALRNVRADLPADEDTTQSATPERLGLVPPRRRPVALGVTLGLVLAVGVGVAAVRAGFLGGSSARRAEAVSVGPQRDAVQRHARAYTRQGFEDARVELAQALALSPNHPQLLALRAFLDAAAAEMLRSQADDLDQQARTATAGVDEAALRAQAANLRRDAAERVARARDAAQTAAAAPTPGAEADRAERATLLGDTARITGDAEAARRFAETVRASQPRSVEADLFLGLLARDAGSHAEAVAALRSVLARSPGHPRASLGLARALVAQGDVLAARAELDSLLRAAPGHEAATALSQARAAADAVAPAAAAPTPPPAAPTPPPAAPTPPPAVARPAQHTNAEGPRGAGYDQLVAEGDRLQNQGRSTVARERYQAALAQRPGGPEALVGLGHAALDAGDTSLAIARFRQALASSPRYADAYIGLGEAYGHTRAYRPSLQAFQRYLEINPGGAHAGMARRQIQALEERLRDATGSETAPPSSEP